MVLINIFPEDITTTSSSCCTCTIDTTGTKKQDVPDVPDIHTNTACKSIDRSGSSISDDSSSDDESVALAPSRITIRRRGTIWGKRKNPGTEESSTPSVSISTYTQMQHLKITDADTATKKKCKKSPPVHDDLSSNKSQEDS